MHVGDNIKRIRIEKGLTQKQLGELCDMADSAIRRYENGGANPKPKTILRIANGLGVHFGALIENVPESEIGIVTSEILEAISKIPVSDSASSDFIKKTVSIIENNKQQHLLHFFNALNIAGKDKAIEQVELLTKNPEYRKEDTPDESSN